MTGYGRGELTLHGRTITAELRSVNNRYLDCSVKMPRVYLFAEESLKSAVQAHISRGKVDVYLSVDNQQADQGTITLNHSLAAGYHAALCELRDSLQLKDDISVSLLARFPEMFRVEKPEEDLEQAAEDLRSALELALADFDAMREREGAKLEQDIRRRAEEILRLVGLVELRSPQTVAEYRARLSAKMAETLANTQLDEGRILTEAAIFADKIAVDEETVRLRSHLSQLEHMLGQGGPVGRKLDFLIQEFNREANTIGSKGNDIEIARHVVDIKAEIEKIREQVQNIE